MDCSTVWRLLNVWVKSKRVSKTKSEEMRQEETKIEYIDIVRLSTKIVHSAWLRFKE